MNITGRDDCDTVTTSILPTTPLSFVTTNHHVLCTREIISLVILFVTFSVFLFVS